MLRRISGICAGPWSPEDDNCLDIRKIFGRTLDLGFLPFADSAPDALFLFFVQGTEGSGKHFLEDVLVAGPGTGEEQNPEYQVETERRNEEKNQSSRSHGALFLSVLRGKALRNRAPSGASVNCRRRRLFELGVRQSAPPIAQ